MQNCRNANRPSGCFPQQLDRAGLKKKAKQLEKELVAAKAVSDATDTDCASLREKLASAMEWKQRYDKLFELTDSIRGHSSQGTNYGLQNTVVHRIKPHEPARFDGSQTLRSSRNS